MCSRRKRLIGGPRSLCCPAGKHPIMIATDVAARGLGRSAAMAEGQGLAPGPACPPLASSFPSLLPCLRCQLLLIGCARVLGHACASLLAVSVGVAACWRHVRQLGSIYRAALVTVGCGGQLCSALLGCSPRHQLGLQPAELCGSGSNGSEPSGRVVQRDGSTTHRRLLRRCRGPAVAEPACVVCRAPESLQWPPTPAPFFWLFSGDGRKRLRGLGGHARRPAGHPSGPTLHALSSLPVPCPLAFHACPR